MHPRHQQHSLQNAYPVPRFPPAHTSAAFEAMAARKSLILTPAEIYAEIAHHGGQPAACCKQARATRALYAGAMGATSYILPGTPAGTRAHQLNPPSQQQARRRPSLGGSSSCRCASSPGATSASASACACTSAATSAQTSSRTAQASSPWCVTRPTVTPFSSTPQVIWIGTRGHAWGHALHWVALAVSMLPHHASPGFPSANAAACTQVYGAVGFPASFTMIMVCGSELFTSMCAYMMAAWWEGKVTMKDCIRLWVVSWLGNFIGCAIFTGLVLSTGLWEGRDWYLLLTATKKVRFVAPGSHAPRSRYSTCGRLGLCCLTEASYGDQTA